MHEPIVVTQGQDRVSVELPGAENEEELRRLIGATGVLDVPGHRPQLGSVRNVCTGAATGR